MVAFLTLGCRAGESADFPPGFQWGVATSAHQSEGRNVASDWHAFEGMGAIPPAGWAQNALELYDRDADNSASIHANTFQLTIEWARIVPTRPADIATLGPDDIDWQAVAHYHAVIDSLTSRGLEPFVAVTHFSLPRWVHDPAAYDPHTNSFGDNIGGWTNPEIAAAMAAYAGFLAEEFGDQVHWWLTIDEPLVVFLAGFVSGDFPPGLSDLSFFDAKHPNGASTLDIIKNMIDAHARSYRAIKAVRPAAQVSLAKNAPAWSAADAESPDDVKAAERVHYMYNLVFLDALTTGRLDESLVGDGPFTEHPEWRESLDFLGVNFYDHNPVVASPGLFSPLDAVPCSPAVASAMPGLFELLGCPPEGLSEPEGLEIVLASFHDRYHLPMIITENGFIDTPANKATRLVGILRALHRAMKRGADVRGYHYWTLNYDYEWSDGWSQDMGLFTCAGFGPIVKSALSESPSAPDANTDFTRVPLSPFPEVFASIASANQVPADIEAQFGL